MCHTYVNDALTNPVELRGTNPRRALKYAYLFVPEFVRVAHEDAEMGFLALLFVEAGGVSRSCYVRDPMIIGHIWVQHQLKAIGNLKEIHFNHTVARPTPAPTTPLRIRIPPERDYGDLYD